LQIEAAFRAMHDLATKAFWIYVVLLLVGGFIGFFKGRSIVSLVMSVTFAVLLILTTFHNVFQPSFANAMENVLLIALVIVFTIRLAKTKKFIPAGLMLIATIAMLAIKNSLK